MIRDGHWSCGARRRVLFVLGGLLVTCLTSSPALGDVTFTYTTHAAFQAVLHGEDDVWGNTAWPGGGAAPYPIRLTGVVINNPWDMLNYDNAAGQPQWQVFVQATAAGDFGGTSLYMRKYIPWNPSQNYTDAQWGAEMARLNHPGGVAEPLQRGDRINVYARAPGAFYNGKYNVNETHMKDPLLDFDIEILERGIDLAPLAAQIALSDLTVGGSNGFIFDGTRATGCEHYQGSLVHLDNLLLDDPQNWGLNGTVTVRQDDLIFKMLLGLDPDLALIDASLLATNPFSVTAILDQEDSSAPYTGGYRLWLTNASDLSAVPEPGTLVLALLGGLLVSPLVRRMGRSRTR